MTTLFVLAFIGAITPGPDILLVLNNTLKFGFLYGLRVFIGIATGWILYLGIIYFGLGYLLQHAITQIVLSMFGGCYLLYLTFILLKTQAPNMQDTQNTQKPDSYLKALSINLSNPKAILFFSIIVTPFINANPIKSLFVLFCGLTLGFLSVMFLAIFFRHSINAKFYIFLDRICAVLFALFALRLFFYGYEMIHHYW